MAKRIKMPTVKPEKRLEWLKRVEQGETPPQIAETDKVDVRTVRKHVELGRMERDVQQARSMVLKEALEGHYHDLLDTIRTIQSQVTAEAQVSSEKESPLIYGLHQHMPRSPLFENLRKWNRALAEITDLQDKIKDNIQKEIEADAGLKNITSKGAKGIFNAAIEVLLHQVNSWAKGQEGLKLDRNIRLENGRDGKVIMYYGFSSFGEIENDKVEIIKSVLRDCELKINGNTDSIELEALMGRLSRLKKNLSETITTILLRRIVPGKCKYCPL